MVTGTILWFGGHSPAGSADSALIFGASLSRTVTLKLQLAPLLSVQVTGVVPTGKNDPEAGLQVTGPHIPLVVGGAKLTTAPHRFGSFTWVILAGQARVQP